MTMLTMAIPGMQILNFFSLKVGGLLSGKVVGRINEVTLRRARLVLRWVTVRGIPSWYITKPPRPTQPGHSSVGRLNEY